MDNLKIEAVKSEPTQQNDSNGSINDRLESVDAIRQNEDLTSCLEPSFKSSKLQTLVTMVREALDNQPEDKLIVVSEWIGVLKIVGKHLTTDVTVSDRHMVS